MVEKTIGSRVHARQLLALLEQLLSLKAALPVCIWGKHGIGKTALVKHYASTRQLELKVLSPAQFEELGDLIGMPSKQDEQTRLLPPSWVPKGSKSGILLIDDINRADERILRGLMPLLLERQMLSWALPENWQIVCTANPDTGDYAVTPLDPALLTRMSHFTMEFDVESWSGWAKSQHITEECIRFVESGKADFSLERTTPRTLSQFFLTLNSLPEQSIPSIQTIAAAFVNESTAEAFCAFLETNKGTWVAPNEFLSSSDPEEHREVIGKILVNPEIRSLFLHKLMEVFNQRSQRIPLQAKSNITWLIGHMKEESNVKIQFGRSLALSKNKTVQQWLQDEQINDLLF